LGLENLKTAIRVNDTAYVAKAQYLPPLRQQVADQQEAAEWLDNMVYKHDAGLDIRLDGECPLKVEPIE
jgi:hypothetical protein